MNSKELYLKGFYSEAAQAATTKNTVSFKIGGLVFTGQHQVARIYFKDHYKNMDANDKAIANFHMGLSHTRTSEYQKAKEFFLENLKIKNTNNLKPASLFFCYHGLGFYRYFFSKHKKSLNWSTKGYTCLIKDKSPEPLLIALSLDLQGHNLCQIGKIHRGLAQLQKALDLSLTHELKNLSLSIEVSFHLYSSDFDDNTKLQIEILNKLIKKNEKNNDYSQSELILQIAKLYLILGKYKLAHDYLTINYDIIYRNENKRNISKLNTLMAQLLFKRQQYIEALSVANIARKNLDETIDISLIFPILAIEIKTSLQLGKNTEALYAFADKLVKKTDNQLNKKMYARLKSQVFETESSEDKLGVLIDRVTRQDPYAFDQIIQKENYGLLPKYFKIPSHHHAIVVAEDKKTLILIDGDEVSVQKKITKTQILFLKTLAKMNCSKEFLINTVWGYEYDSLRHDSLIYTTVTRLKKIFGSKKYWLVTDENKYFINENIHIYFKNTKKFNTEKLNKPITPTTKSTIKKLHKNQEAAKPISDALDFNFIEEINNKYTNFNYRQLQLLAAPPEDSLSVSQYGKIWNITRMTALRDLKHLCDYNLVFKSGHGKATRYYIRKDKY